jgi:hypothetical protein
MSIESDTDQVNTASTHRRSQTANPLPLGRVDPVDRIAGLAGRADLDKHPSCAVRGNKIHLSPGNLDVAVDDVQAVLTEKPCGNGLTGPTEVPAGVVYSESSACSSCSTLTSRKVNT